jgi:hypothetical protein
VVGRICTEHPRPRLEAACDELRPDLIIREPCEYAFDRRRRARSRGVPQVEALATARLVVCHGGRGTAAAAGAREGNRRGAGFV